MSLCKKHLFELKHPPSLLEIGVDRGVSFLTLATFLARSKQEFLAIGIDIMIQEQVQIMLQHLDLQPKQCAYLLEGNSLDLLPKIVKQGMKFDVLLIDGDHNYHTVSKELQYVEALTNPDSIVICDDCFGRWSEKDLFYCDREGYENNKFATSKVDTEKHGVKPAIDEWLSSHPDWVGSQPIQGEPIMLTRRNK